MVGHMEGRGAERRAKGQASLARSTATATAFASTNHPRDERFNEHSVMWLTSVITALWVAAAAWRFAVINDNGSVILRGYDITIGVNCPQKKRKNQTS